MGPRSFLCLALLLSAVSGQDSRPVRAVAKALGTTIFVGPGVRGPLATALQQIGDAGRVSVTAGPGVRGTVTMYLREVPWRHALRLAALAVHAVEVRQQDGSYVLRPSEILRSVTVDGTELEVTRVSTEDLSLSCPALARRWRRVLGPLAIPADEPLPEGTVLATPFRMSSPMVLARVLSDLLGLEFVEQEGRLSLSALKR